MIGDIPQHVSSAKKSPVCLPEFSKLGVFLNAVRERLRLRLRTYALEVLLRAAEPLLPVVADALPRDRGARARWGFRHMKDALENAGPEVRP